MTSDVLIEQTAPGREASRQHVRDAHRDAPARDAAAVEFSERMLFLIYRLSAQAAQHSSRLFREYAVDFYTARIVVLILEREAMPIGDIVDAMRLPQSTVSHQVRRLTGAGLLRRLEAHDGGRANWVALTEKGERVAQACDRMSRGLNRALLMDIPAEDLAVTRNTLKRMFGNLQSAAPDRV